MFFSPKYLNLIFQCLDLSYFNIADIGQEASISNNLIGDFFIELTFVEKLKNQMHRRRLSKSSD